MMRLAITTWKYQNIKTSCIIHCWLCKLRCEPAIVFTQILCLYLTITCLGSTVQIHKKGQLWAPQSHSPRILAFALHSWLTLALIICPHLSTSPLLFIFWSQIVWNLNLKASILWDPLLLPCPKCSFSRFLCLRLTVPRTTPGYPTWLILLPGWAALCGWPWWGSQNPRRFTTAHPSALKAFLKMKTLSRK